MSLLSPFLQDFPKLHHISTGDLLRQHVRSETEIGKEAKQYMDEGKLVPDSVMVNLVMEDATPYVEEGRSLLLDGFPRTIEQAKSLDSVVNVDLVINLDIPTETIVERISDRWIHPPSGRVYSYSYKPPKVKGKDDITGEPLVQRDDDKPSCVRNRLASYDKVSLQNELLCVHIASCRY
jgi:nucleoside-triphosphate--adenylate kinase